MKKLKEIVLNIFHKILKYINLLLWKLLFFLIPILFISFLFYIDIIFIIIKHLIKYEYIDWNIVLRWGRHRRDIHYYRSLGDESIYRMKMVIILMLLFVILYIIHNIKEKISQKNKISSINHGIDKYYDEFISKFNDSIDHFPVNIDMKQFLNPVKIKILKMLILQKIQIFSNMTLLQQYSFIFLQNTKEINIGDSSAYGINDNCEINNLVYDIQAPEYISLKIVSSKEAQGNIVNINYYKNEDKYKNKSVLQLVFNQYLIIKDIILKAFLNEDPDNQWIRDNIINQIQNYKNNNITDSNYNKVQLLINIVKENINENKEFKEKFFKVLNTNE